MPVPGFSLVLCLIPDFVEDGVCPTMLINYPVNCFINSSDNNDNNNDNNN
jgi:hypothetical protein